MTLAPELEMCPLVALATSASAGCTGGSGDPEQAEERLTTVDGDVRPAGHDALAVDAAQDRVGSFVFRFEAIGTQWEIETPEPLGRPLHRGVLERIQQFDTTYSRFPPDSLVARIAAAPDGDRRRAHAVYRCQDAFGPASPRAVFPHRARASYLPSISGQHDPLARLVIEAPHIA
jgi:hypothetical protein